MSYQTGNLQGTIKAKGVLSGNIASSGQLMGAVVIPTSVHSETYDGEYVITPKLSEDVILKTKAKVLRDDLTIRKIPQYEVSNESGGKTFIIGERYNENG